MKIILSPQRSDAELTLDKAGDVLTINGEAFDFGPLAAGATLPREAIESDHFAGPVERDAEGGLTITLRFPIGPWAGEDARFPAPVVLTQDGPISLPAPGQTKPEEAFE